MSFVVVVPPKLRYRRPDEVPKRMPKGLKPVNVDEVATEIVACFVIAPPIGWLTTVGLGKLVDGNVADTEGGRPAHSSLLSTSASSTGGLNHGHRWETHDDGRHGG